MKNIKIMQVICILSITLGICSNLSASPKRNISYTGWVDVEYRGDNKSGSKPYFDASHLLLISEAKFEKKFSSFMEIEIEHLPNTSSHQGNIKVGRLYIQKEISNHLGFRIGKFSTPFGYWTPTHWQILVETATVPIHESNEYIPCQNVGVEGYGFIFIKEHELEWKLYFSNGSEVDGTNLPEDQTFGGGGDLRFVFADGNSFIGVSSYYQRNPKFEGRKENSYVGYGGTRLGKFDIRGEYIYQIRSDGNNNTIYNDVSTFYISGKYNVSSDIALGSRYDYGDDERMNMKSHHSMKSLFLNWTPIPEIIGKLEYDFHRSDMKMHPGKDSWALYLGLIF